MEQLVLILTGSIDCRVLWCAIQAESKEIVATGYLEHYTAVSTLEPRIKQLPCTVLVPPSHCRLTTVSLPAKANQKILNAIPYMLEEEVLGDVNEHFFALGAIEQNQQQVAVITEAYLQQLITIASEHGLNLQRIVPAILCLPVPAKPNAHLVAVDNLVLVRTGIWSGYGGSAALVQQLLMSEQNTLGATAEALATDQELAVSFHAFSDLPAPLTLPNTHYHYERLPLELLARGALGQQVNLRQGRHRYRNPRSNVWSIWSKAASIAVLALLLNIVNIEVTRYQLEQQSQSYQKNIDELVKSRFPALGPYRDLKRKITQEMQQLESGSGNLALLVVLTQLAPSFKDNQIRLESIQFNGERGELRMQAMGANFERLESLRRDIEDGGYTVEQGAINNRGDQVIGTLVVKAA